MDDRILLLSNTYPYTGTNLPLVFSSFERTEGRSILFEISEIIFSSKTFSISLFMATVLCCIVGSKAQAPLGNKKSTDKATAKQNERIERKVISVIYNKRRENEPAVLQTRDDRYPQKAIYCK